MAVRPLVFTETVTVPGTEMRVLAGDTLNHPELLAETVNCEAVEEVTVRVWLGGVPPTVVLNASDPWLKVSGPLPTKVLPLTMMATGSVQVLSAALETVKVIEPIFNPLASEDGFNCTRQVATVVGLGQFTVIQDADAVAVTDWAELSLV